MQVGKNSWRRERDSNPRSRFEQDTRLAGEPLRPLGHLSASGFDFNYKTRGTFRQIRQSKKMAEGVGFEPTGVSPIPFQAGRLKPLGHPSATLIRSKNPQTQKGARSSPLFNTFDPMHIGPQHFRDEHASISLLIILQNRHEGPSYGQP